jgi:hypothetical protein
LNNNCQITQPLSLSLVGNTNQSCLCDGNATISASGSVGPYDYAWYNNTNASINQSTATANNLCSGSYYCVVTSSTGCSDTIDVFIGSNCSNFGTFASATMVESCVNNQFYNTTWSNLPDQINPNGVANSFNWVYINGLGERDQNNVSKNDLLTAIAYDKTGKYLAVGD